MAFLKLFKCGKVQDDAGRLHVQPKNNTGHSNIPPNHYGALQSAQVNDAQKTSQEELNRIDEALDKWGLGPIR